jgi:hypothetical protein
MIDSSGSDIVDPFFGDAHLYLGVCHMLLEETPKSLMGVLKEKKLVG